jgi:DNA repair protein RadD
MSLRPYQEKLNADILAAFDAGYRSVIAVMPTGAGKTINAAALIEHYVAQMRSVIIFAHTREIVRKHLTS